ncbi:hypothetical protein VTH06DRAFT_8749 [Thermothelomyces fergusii]
MVRGPQVQHGPEHDLAGPVVRRQAAAGRVDEARAERGAAAIAAAVWRRDVQRRGEPGNLGRGRRGGLAAAEGVDGRRGEGDEGRRRLAGGRAVLEIEMLAPEVLLHPAGQAVRNIVRVDAREVQVPEAERGHRGPGGPRGDGLGLGIREQTSSGPPWANSARLVAGLVSECMYVAMYCTHKHYTPAARITEER